MKKIKISKVDKDRLMMATKKIIGQMQSIAAIIDSDQITDQTFIQLLAVKGGASKICKEIISKGVLKNLKDYTPEEIDNALNIIFKLA